MKYFVLTGLAVCAAAAVAYYAYKKSKSSNGFPKSIPGIAITNKKEIDGALNFMDVVAWFKKLTFLDKEKHVPFFANAEKFKELLTIEGEVTKPVSILLGVYDEEKNEIIEHLLITCDELDAKSKEVLGENPLVVLS